MLQTRNLQYSYDGKIMLSFPDIHCGQGEQWLLLGDSGSGKTTLLHLLGGLLTPSSGTVTVKDTDMGKLSQAGRDRFRGRHVGFVFQVPHFVRALSATENLLLAQQLAGVKPDKQRAAELLQRLHLSHRAAARPGQLSQGEQQRLSIARALINRPAIILADEPTSALDDRNCREVLQLLEQQAGQEGATLLIVTHDNRLKSAFDRQIAIA